MLNTLKENWYFVVSWIIVMTVFASIQYIYQQKINQHLENLNINFSGVVTKDTLMPNHHHVMSVDVTTANPTHYDVRETEEIYFCVLKGDKAEFIIEPFKYQLEVGDSISVISKPLRLINYKKKTIQKIKISTMFPFSLYNDLKDYHEL